MDEKWSSFFLSILQTLPFYNHNLVSSLISFLFYLFCSIIMTLEYLLLHNSETFLTHAYMSCPFIPWPQLFVLNVQYMYFCIKFRNFQMVRSGFNDPKLNTVNKYMYCSFYWYLMFRFGNPLNYSQCSMALTFDFHFFLIKCCFD